ncbi:hypothetical protein, partial [Streptomyces sp. SID3343]|uniref:hypothetical protein n=1 Tax=Streptomyces sp. SID3343 TaxID=2690260 RepID=UPI001367E919
GAVPAPAAETVRAAAGRVREQAPVIGPAIYSGATLEADGFTVYRVRDAEFDRVVRALAGDVTVRFVDTRYPHTDAERIRRAAMDTTEARFSVVSASIRPDCEVVTVGVSGDVDAARRTLTARFGARVLVEAGEPVVPM